MLLTEWVPYAGPGALVVLLFLLDLSRPENSKKLHKGPWLTLNFLGLGTQPGPGTSSWNLEAGS